MLRRVVSQAENFDIGEVTILSNGVNVALGKTVTHGNQGINRANVIENMVRGDGQTTSYASATFALNSWVLFDGCEVGDVFDIMRFKDLRRVISETR
jgi:hypothetical protein